jgi:hypothetical protein
VKVLPGFESLYVRPEIIRLPVCCFPTEATPDRLMR